MRPFMKYLSGFPSSNWVLLPLDRFIFKFLLPSWKIVVCLYLRLFCEQVCNKIDAQERMLLLIMLWMWRKRGSSSHHGLWNKKIGFTPKYLFNFQMKLPNILFQIWKLLCSFNHREGNIYPLFVEKDSSTVGQMNP